MYLQQEREGSGEGRRNERKGVVRGGGRREGGGAKGMYNVPALSG